MIDGKCYERRTRKLNEYKKDILRYYNERTMSKITTGKFFI
jgi:hypothetical protein